MWKMGALKKKLPKSVFRNIVVFQTKSKLTEAQRAFSPPISSSSHLYSLLLLVREQSHPNDDTYAQMLQNKKCS